MKYLSITITTLSGQIVKQPLKLSEVRLIIKMVAENQKVEVKEAECTRKDYKIMFG